MTFSGITAPLNSTPPVLLTSGSAQTSPIKSSSPSPEKIKKIALKILFALCLISSAAIGTGVSTLILITVGITTAATIIIGAVALAILYREVKQDKIKKRFFFNNTCTPGEAILKELNAFPECAALIKEANDVIARCNLPPLEIHIEKIEGGFRGQQCSNVIKVAPGLTAPITLSTAIFELTNLTQHEKFLAVNQKLIKGDYTSAEEFAKAMEFIEYHGVIRENDIAQRINTQRKRYFKPYIDNPYKKYSLKTIGFDQYYNTLIDNNHKEYYRKGWVKYQADKAKSQADMANYEEEMRKNLAKVAEVKTFLAEYRAKHFPPRQQSQAATAPSKF